MFVAARHVQRHWGGNRSSFAVDYSVALSLKISGKVLLGGAVCICQIKATPVHHLSCHFDGILGM
jgi:hypothetical protein